MKRVAGLLLALLLAGCGDALFDVCRACLKSDPQRPVAKQDYPLITVVYRDRPLPASAANVYYREKCGIDCMQMIRFDAPLADARAYAEQALQTGKLRQGFNPWVDGNGFDPWAGSGEPTSWWPRRISGRFYGAEDSGGQPMKIAMVPRGDMATVLVTAFDM